MSRRFRVRSPRDGFSLIEVIVVLVVLVVLAVTFVSGMETGADVAAAADILRSHLGFVQALAMANNTATWGVSFEANAYTLVCTPTPAHLPAWPNESSARYVLPAGVKIISGLGVVTLDEYGAPAATHVVIFSDDEQQQQVSITGFTGLVP